MNKNCTIIVNSCDKYADVWTPFFSVLKDKWPDCPYDIVLNTESKSFNFSGLNIITFNLFTAEEKDTWGKRFKETLLEINTEYVINLFDDYILDDFVKQDKIQQCIEWMNADKDISVFYFSNNEGDNIDDDTYDGFELIPQRKDYKLNTAPAIWRREDLLFYTGSKDTPWAWEFFGSARTYRTNKLFYCARKDREDIYKYKYQLGGAIHRGKWVTSVIEPVVKKYNLDLDLSIRGFQDENLGLYKHTFRWKVDFLITGYKMIGIDACIFIYRSARKRLVRLIK